MEVASSRRLQGYLSKRLLIIKLGSAVLSRYTGDGTAASFLLLRVVT